MAAGEPAIEERAKAIAAAGIMPEPEALEMLAIATGLADGCCEEEDEDGHLIPRTPRTTPDS